MSEGVDPSRTSADESLAVSSGSDAATWRPKANPWLIAVIVSLGAFMEVLDTSIANVALPYIAGSVGATSDQSTWILTSYLVSNAIVLPLAGWFVRVFGRKRFFLACLVMFTLCSLLCGIAPSLGAIIAFRVLQGLGGGGLQPMAQAILADTFPPHQRGLGFAAFGITVVVAPVLGPTLGGWITDNYTWRWIFLINLPVGILASLLVARFVEDPPWQTRVSRSGLRIDYIGAALLVLGVGALQIMLDKGQESDWFASSFIVALAVIAVTGLIGLVLWEWFHDDPIVDVRLFSHFNFLSANVIIFVAGLVMFSGLVLMPQYLQLLMGYSSESAGLVLSAGGLLLVVLMPLAGTLASKFQARNVIATGWLITAVTMYYSARHLTLTMDFGEASMLRVLQVAGLPLLFVPIIMASYIGLPRESSNNVAGLMSFARNIGASIGTSLVTTLVARQAQFHQVHLVAQVTAGDPQVTQAAAALSTNLAQVGGVDSSTAAQQAYGLIYRLVMAQATALAYVDIYSLLAVACAVMVPLCLLLRRNLPGATATRFMLTRGRLKLPMRIWMSFAVVGWTAWLVPLSAYAGQMQGQASLQGQSQVPTQISAPQSTSSDNPFRGSVRTGKATAETIPLSLADAIGRALEHNLGLVTGVQDSRAARAERLQRLSALLPDVSARVSGTRETIDLQALGFNSSVLPAGMNPPVVVGPFGVADARVSVSQSIVNWADIKSWRAAKESERASQLSAKNDRELVVVSTAYAYLTVIADRAALDAIRAQVATAQALHDRAVDQQKAGVIAGIDVLRAQVELQTQQQRRIAAEAQLAIDKLALGRVIGLPNGQAFEIRDAVPYAPLDGMTLEQALAQARATRPDYFSAQAQAHAASLAREAAVAGNYPSLSLDANVGRIGSPNFGQARGTYAVAVALSVPIFQGGRLLADTLRADAALAQRRAIVADLEGHIDDQVRTAFLTLRSSADLVEVTRSSVELATQTLTQAQDRFAAGVADNLEVVQAQESVASAHQSHIASLFSYNVAKISLAQALGIAESSGLQFLSAGQTSPR